MLDRYNSILNAIKSLSPAAHIGGGAVRDSLIGKPFWDIDLFLHEAVADEAAKMLRSKFSFVKVGEWESYERFSDPAVVRVARFEKWDEETPVCLIGLNRPRGMKENVARFDFGACMCAWDGNDVYTAPEYTSDICEKTFTLCRADDQLQFDYSMCRFSKLTLERYTGWKLVVPARFEAFAREYTFRKVWYRARDDDLKLIDFSGLWLGPQRLKPKTGV